MEREYISYIHDGSETQADSFTIMANQTEVRKHSRPCTVHITVTPVNDETPVITANKGLRVCSKNKKKIFHFQWKCHLSFAFIAQVWVGSVTEVTVLELSAEDSDTPDEGLEFVVTPPSNGHLALKSVPSRHILNFTQGHIASRQLLFVHSGQLLRFADCSCCILQNEKTRKRESSSFADVCVQELCQVVFTSR